jgi:hypothetical protein
MEIMYSFNSPEKEVPGKPEVLVQGQRLVLRQDRDLADAGIDAVRKRKIDDAVVPAEGDRRFCTVDREGMKPFPLAAGKNHSQDAHALWLLHR